jgi:alkylated DNA repair protein (DNA oxidative demethylase)
MRNSADEITRDLFAATGPAIEALGAQAVVLRGFASDAEAALLQEVRDLVKVAPWRQLTTPGGFTMSVAITNTGTVGWTSDTCGYRYDPLDPLTQRSWPPMPTSFAALAARAASFAGFAGFVPDACLINRYTTGARLSLHRDFDERDAAAPIVSVSLGVSARFLWGGLRRSDPVRRLSLHSGDVVVWGGASRFVYHGIAPLREGAHPLTGAERINLTFRKAR